MWKNDTISFDQTDATKYADIKALATADGTTKFKGNIDGAEFTVVLGSVNEFIWDGVRVWVWINPATGGLETAGVSKPVYP